MVFNLYSVLFGNLSDRIFRSMETFRKQRPYSDRARSCSYFINLPVRNKSGNDRSRKQDKKSGRTNKKLENTVSKDK